MTHPEASSTPPPNPSRALEPPVLNDPAQSPPQPRRSANRPRHRSGSALEDPRPRAMRSRPGPSAPTITMTRSSRRRRNRGEIDAEAMVSTRSLEAVLTNWRGAPPVLARARTAPGAPRPSRCGSPCDRGIAAPRFSSTPSAPSAAAVRNRPPMLSGLPTPSSASTHRRLQVRELRGGGRVTSARQPRWKL